MSDFLRELPPYFDVEIERINRTGQLYGRNLHGEKTIRTSNFRVIIYDPFIYKYRRTYIRGEGETIDQAIVHLEMEFDKVFAAGELVIRTPEEVDNLLDEKTSLAPGYMPHDHVGYESGDEIPLTRSKRLLDIDEYAREIRCVAPDWEHPKSKYGWYIPLGGAFRIAMNHWTEGAKAWDGLIEDELAPKRSEYPAGAEYHKLFPRPSPRDFMPTWAADKATAYQIYENATEGTPLSPVLPDRGALRKWFIDQGYPAGHVLKFAKEWAAKRDQFGTIWPTSANFT